MGSNQIEFRESNQENSEEICQFLNLPESGFYRYEFDSFHPKQSVFITARHNGKLVGTQGLIPYPLVIDGQVVMTGRSERTMTDTNYRGGKLFPDLMKLCVNQGFSKGLNLIWGTTTAKSAFNKVGFNFMDNFIEHALLCVKGSAVLSDIRRTERRSLKIAKAITWLPSIMIHSIFRLFTNRAFKGTNFEVLTEPRSYDDINNLYEKLHDNGHLIHLHHSESFCKWLLGEGNRRIMKYFVYSARDLISYAYVDVTDPSTAVLVDFAALNFCAFHHLISQITLDMTKRNIAFIYTYYNATNRLLRISRLHLFLAGFIPFFRGGGFVIRKLTAGHEFLDDIRSWYITGSWMMLYKYHR